MPKTGISVTLGDTNLLWLKGRVRATGGRSLSETLDDLITAARTSGKATAGAIRSVAGTVDIADDDTGLERADAYIHELFEQSAKRPIVAREEPPASRPPARRGKSRG